MAKKKTGLTLSYSEWNQKKQYKVNESVFIDGVLYQNSTGRNTDPRLLLDWVVIETEIQSNIDSIIVRTGYTIAPNNIIFNSGYVWKILGSQYQLSNSKSFSITPIVTTGNFRIDIIVANQNNDFEKIEGIEGVNTTAPNIPENTLLVESLFISDSGFIIEPIPENLYVERNEFKFVDYYMSNSGILNLASNSGYSIITNSAPLKAVLVANNQMGYLWNGKEYKIKNDTLNDIVIKHLDTTLNGFSYRKFYFPTLTDYTLKPNEIIRFVFVNDRLIFLGSNMSSASGGVRVIIKDFNLDNTVQTQGVTGNIVLKNYIIPSGTIPQNCMLRVTFKMEKSGTEGACNVSFGTGISPTYPIHAVTFFPANKSMAMYRTPIIKSGNMYNNMLVSGAQLTDITSNVNGYKGRPFDVNTDQTMSLRVNVTNATDIIRLVSLIVEVIE